MGPLARVVVAGVLGLNAAALRAQTGPIPADARAQRLVSSTRSGQEGGLSCDGLDAAVVQALIDVGLAVDANSLERATVAFRLAERGARCVESRRLLGAALNELAGVLQTRGDNNGALAAARESVEIHAGARDMAGLARAWNIIGNVHWWLGDMAVALDDFQRSLDFSTAAADRSLQARAFNNIGNVRKYLGEFDVALEAYSRALGILLDLGDRRRAAIVTGNIGLIYTWRGDYPAALDYSERALATQRELGDRLGAGKTRDAIGAIYRALGAYDLALQTFEEALLDRTAVGDRPGVMETTHNIGLIHFSRGDYELAIRAYQQGIRLNREWALGDDSLVAEALRNIGAAAWRLGQHQRAAANFRESLSIVRRIGQRSHEGELLNDLGQVALAEGRLVESSRLLDQSLAIRRALGDQSGVSETLTSLAATRLAQHRGEAALDLARRALDNPATHDQPELSWQAHTAAAMAYRRLGRQDDAKRALGDAIRSIEQVSDRLTGSENLRLRFIENKLSPYHELIALLIQQRAFGDALELAERSKARVLTRLLLATRDDHSNMLGADETREQARLRDRLQAFNQEIEREEEKKPPDQDQLTRLASARRSARDAVAAFETVLVARHPELATVRGELAPLKVSEARRMLIDGRTGIVEYVVADRQLFAFVLTSTGTQVTVEAHAIPIDAIALATRVERFRREISSRDFGFADDARSLYETVLGPFRARLAGMSRLIVVPDGVLWNVPFQALLGPDGYVIEAAAVSYAPSITALREIDRQPKPSSPRTLFAMAKAQFPSPSVLEPLPEAETQVRLIRDIYGAERSATYVGSDATESRFKTAAPRYSVLHLATHGVLDEASPLYSHLVLSASRDNPEDDGRLEAWEIMRMKLTADLVVLAACDTGRGRIAPGEGVIGMMWALFAAGARSIVVSQFPVESTSATTLLVGFHRRLAAEPGSKAAQLRAAALDLLQTPRYAHPYYWAGFILVGDSD